MTKLYKLYRALILKRVHSMCNQNMVNNRRNCTILRNNLLIDAKSYSLAHVFVEHLGCGFCDAMYVCFKLDLAKKYSQKVKEKDLSADKTTQCQSAVNKLTERHRVREGVQHHKHPHQKTTIFRIAIKRSSRNMTHVPLLNENNNENNEKNTVMLEVGPPGDTWRYCVERHRLAEKSEWFRALLLGPLAAPESEPTIKLQYIDKRAFDHLLRYLHDETVTFQSISTARATLDVAHEYLCPGLALLAVDYLDANLKASTVLEVYQGLSLYASDLSIVGVTTPSAPPDPEDHAGEIACACAKLLGTCLRVIDSNPEVVLRQERFEELNGQEVANLASRDSLQLSKELHLFSALERWASSECKKVGMEPNPANKRKVLTDDVLFSVRFLLMSDEEFVKGPMASNMLTSEESACIMGKILGHNENRDNGMNRRTGSEFLMRLNSMPRGRSRSRGNTSISSSNGNTEREDNKKNRRKECATQSQKVCAQIGNCFVRVLACVFD